MISSMFVLGLLFVFASLCGLGYLHTLYAAQDQAIADERARAGLPALPPRAADATPLMGAFLALGGAGTALGLVLLAASFIILL